MGVLSESQTAALYGASETSGRRFIISVTETKPDSADLLLILFSINQLKDTISAPFALVAVSCWLSETHVTLLALWDDYHGDENMWM